MKNTILKIFLLTFPISTSLGLTSLFMRQFISFPAQGTQRWAEAVTQQGHTLSWILYAIAYILPILGFWAVYEILKKENRYSGKALAGFLAAIVGTALALPLMGVFLYISPFLGQAVLDGSPELSHIVNEVAFGSSMVLSIPAAVLYVSGCLLLGYCLIRNTSLPDLSGWFLAIHGITLAFGFGIPAVLGISWVLIGLSGVSLYKHV